MKLQDRELKSTMGFITRTNIDWIDIENKNIHVYGTPNNEKIFTRIEKELIGKFSDNIQKLGLMTSGVRIRVKTNSSYMAIKGVLSSKEGMSYMGNIGTSGIDVYVRDEGKEQYLYRATIKPDLNLTSEDVPVVVGECRFEGENIYKDILINLPLYNGVEQLCIGLEEGAEMLSPTPYSIEKPILFYGSSITQGGSASRPGNTYHALLSRWFDADIINLGFSGSAKGESVMAEYISKKEMSMLVIDYDYNAPTLEHLQDTYEDFFEYIRNEQPELPIIMISKPDFDSNKVDNAKRRKVIWEVYKGAKERGEDNLYFIDGASLFQERERDACTVDGCHPNDLGFMRMAEVIAPVIKEILEKQEIYKNKNSKAYTIPFIDLNDREELQTIVDREVGTYLGHPTTVLLDDQDTMWTVYPKGHGAGAVILKKSIDGGQTWSERLQTPKSWEDNKETPILYTIETPWGTTRLLMVSGVITGAGGFRVSYSDDLGENWTEFKTYYENIGVMGVVAFATLLRLKTQEGDWDHRWMGLFHDHSFKNYKVILSFDEEGEMLISIPEAYLGGDKVVKVYDEDGLLVDTKSIRQDYRSIETYAGLCEPCGLRSPDGSQIAVILRGNKKVTSSMVIFSDDEGQTWSRPREVAGALRGERHQAKYDCITGKLLITFRSYGIPENPDDRHWVAWLGTYEDLIHGTEGECRIQLKRNIGTVSWNGNDADCGYAGIEQITDAAHKDYGTYILTSYGHWDEDHINHEPYIISVRFKLEDLKKD